MLTKNQRMFLILILAGLTYYNWPGKPTVLVPPPPGDIAEYSSTDPFDRTTVETDDCKDEVAINTIIEKLDLFKSAVVKTYKTGIGLTLDIESTKPVPGKRPLVFRQGSLMGLVIQCVKKENSEHCGYEQPYEVFVGQCRLKRPVRVTSWDWKNKFDKVWVGHGPGDGEYPSGRIAVHISKGGEEVGFMELRSLVKSSVVDSLKRKDVLDTESFIKESEPYKAYVNGIEMRITSPII